MNQNGCVIRQEMNSERREVEALVRDTFWNVYRPGCLEHYLLHVLRDDPDFVEELNLVLEKDGRVIGHAAFVRSHIRKDDGQALPSLTLGPICIAPDCQRQGYGKLLLDECLRRAAAMGAGCVCLEGNFDFYGKCGFVRAGEKGLRYRGLPEGEDAAFFLCNELTPGYLSGVTGEYGPPDVYFVDEAAAEVFDRAFPPKVKLKLDSQIFADSVR